MKKLIPFLSLLFVNNAFAHGGSEILIFIAGGVLLFLLFHALYSAIMTYMSPKGKKLNTFIWSFFIPPVFWIVIFYFARLMVVLVDGGKFAYIIFALTVLGVPIGLYYFMREQNFFTNEPK
jgi:hypothetical protein